MNSQSNDYCLNCGNQLTGKFCSDCGQASSTRPITLSNALNNTISEITSYDGRVLTTLKEMFPNPGKATLEYVLGKRVRFIHPIKYFLIIMGLNLVVMQLLQHQGLLPEAKIVLPEFIELPEKERLFLAEKILKYAQFIMLLFIPVYASFLSLLFQRTRSTGEVTALLLYLNANLALISTLLLVLRVSPSVIVDSAISILSIVYSFFAIKVFFEKKLMHSVWRIAVAYVCYM